MGPLVPQLPPDTLRQAQGGRISEAEALGPNEALLARQSELSPLLWLGREVPGWLWVAEKSRQVVQPVWTERQMSNAQLPNRPPYTLHEQVWYVWF